PPASPLFPYTTLFRSVVAERVHPGGVFRIVETRQGLVMAAAGIDMSNVPEGTALRLPLDPDASAWGLCAGLRRRLGIEIGVIIRSEEHTSELQSRENL